MTEYQVGDTLRVFKRMYPGFEKGAGTATVTRVTKTTVRATNAHDVEFVFRRQGDSLAVFTGQGAWRRPAYRAERVDGGAS